MNPRVEKAKAEQVCSSHDLLTLLWIIFGLHRSTSRGDHIAMSSTNDAPEPSPKRTLARSDYGYMRAAIDQLAASVASAPSFAVLESIQRLGNAETKNVQQIAASQLELLATYHQVTLEQSRRSFFWALIGSGAGLVLFIVAVVFALWKGLSLAAIVPLASGAIVQIVSGVVFYLYGQTSPQLSAFHSRLEVLQRYLLANSICESLSDGERDKARAALIQEISRGQPVK